MAKRSTLRVGDPVILLGAGLRNDLIGCTGTVIGFYNLHDNRLTLARIAPDDRPQSLVSLPLEFIRHNPGDAALRQLLRVAPPPPLSPDWSRLATWDAVGWKPNLEKYATVISMKLTTLRIKRIGGKK